MPVEMELRYNDADFDDLRGRLAAFPKAVPTVLFRALNAAIRPAYKQVVKAVKEKGNLRSQKEAKRRIKLDKAQRKRLRAKIVASPKKFPLYSHKAKQTARGVTAVIGGERQLFAHTFIATLRKSGHTGVYRRKDKERFPIIAQLGESPSALMKPLAKRTLAEAYDRFRKRVDVEVDLILSGVRRA